MSLNLGLQRRIQRAVHVAAGLLLLAATYLPIEASGRDFIRWFVLPVLAVTGLWMWNAARIGRFFRSRTSGRSAGARTVSALPPGALEAPPQCR